MNKLSIFQIVVLAIFGVFAVAGLLVFAGVGGFGSDSQDIGEVVIWGTLDYRAFQTVISTLAENDERLLKVSYVEKDPRTYDNDLIEALAAGGGPDIFLLRQDSILRHMDKVLPVPFDSLPKQLFEETFVNAADVFVEEKGITGVPVAVDPLVLYWNEDMLGNVGISRAPKYWGEVVDIASKITKKDASLNIQKSGVSFGEFRNVEHATEILGTLIMQAGGAVTYRTNDGRVRSGLSFQDTDVGQPATNALRFYTEFADPSKNIYSWNRSLPMDREAFISGDLALYIGYASEYSLIKNLNPNLNFSVAPMPQIENVDTDKTFANVYAFSVARTTANPNGAFSTAYILSGKEASALLAEARGTPSPRRDVLEVPADGPDKVFNDMAIIARNWLDPDPEQTAGVFQGMIENVTTGAQRLADAVSRADRELSNLLNDI